MFRKICFKFFFLGISYFLNININVHTNYRDENYDEFSMHEMHFAVFLYVFRFSYFSSLFKHCSLCMKLKIAYLISLILFCKLYAEQKSTCKNNEDCMNKMMQRVNEKVYKMRINDRRCSINKQIN